MCAILWRKRQIEAEYAIAAEAGAPEARFTGLVKGADMDYVCAIEFRPKDLASPRATRRTDDLLPKSRSL
jgi:hypothetical protein